MGFTAECPFCHAQIRNVPERRAGDSYGCRKCGSYFTLIQTASRPEPKPTTVPPVAPVVSSTADVAPQPDFTAPFDTAPAELGPPPVRTPSQAPALVLAPTRRVPEYTPPELPKSRSWFGVGAFCLWSLALLAASIGPFSVLTLPACCVGVCLGSVALLRPAKNQGQFWPAAGVAVSAGVGVVSAFWPSLFDFSRATGPAPLPVSENLVIVPSGDRHGKGAKIASESDWAEAGVKALQKHDVRFQLTSASFKAIELTKDKERRIPRNGRQKKYLFIEFRLSNVGVNQTVEYASWGEVRPGAKGEPILRDNRGKAYPLKVMAEGESVTGHVERAIIGPWKAITDVLVFEPPPNNVEYLRLELPCSAFGASDKFQVEIPRRMMATL